MPNRILREGILTSERVNTLIAPAEVFYRRLMSVVDDFGRYYAKPELLRAACFPLRLDGVKNIDIMKWLAECRNAALLVTYTHDGKDYLEVADFRQQVRAKDSKYPQPTADTMQAYSGCVADAQQVRTKTYSYSETESGHPVAARNGSVGMDSFARFWQAYPKKKAKGDAEKEWEKIRPDEPLTERILRAVEQAKTSADWRRNEGQYVPHPSTWLNRRGWEDELHVAVPTHDPNRLPI